MILDVYEIVGYCPAYKLIKHEDPSELLGNKGIQIMYIKQIIILVMLSPEIINNFVQVSEEM